MQVAPSRSIWVAVFAVVALLAALALERLNPLRIPVKTWQAGLAVAAVLLVLEGIRFGSRPELVLDGRAVSSNDPWPLELHEDRSFEVR